MKTSGKRILLLLLLTLLTVSFVGCSTTSENDNVSSRPWNTPTQWETGLPGGLGGFGGPGR